MGNTYTDEELIGQILDGQEEAITLLIQRYQDFAFNLAFKILRNTQDAEESVQDSFVKAIKAIRAFKQQSSFKTWLYRIVYNTAINRIRSGVFTKRVFIDELTEDQISLGDDVTVDKYDQKIIAKQIRAAFEKLSPQNRIIMSLFYLEHATIEEIADITLLNSNLIKVRLHRSREQLKGVLKNLGDVNNR
jgi:RNA polymerase sigma-70 factor (ECF subfamily)